MAVVRKFRTTRYLAVKGVFFDIFINFTPLKSYLHLTYWQFNGIILIKELPINMPINFNPKYQITRSILEKLYKIDQIKEHVKDMPLTPKVLAGLKETSRIVTTHYSTVIEGNRLTEKEVRQVLKGQAIAGRERDEKEVKGYFKALDEVAILAKKHIVTETNIQTLHGLIIGKNTPTPYRTEQNYVADSATREIIYMPPEAKDVPPMMTGLVEWINESVHTLPIPIVAAIAHYQFVTIHPYYDGNGRTARILTTLILHQGGYDLKGIYNLEEYYYQHLQDYYSALAVGSSHNYYMGRADADITEWIEFFVSGMLHSFQSVQKHFESQKEDKDQSKDINALDSRQKQALMAFSEKDAFTSKDVEELFKFSGRTARQLLQKWVKQGFVTVLSTANKNRKYKIK